MAIVIGIDLGTVNSCVSLIEGGTPRVLCDESGNNTTPSIYAVTATGEPLVGYAAKAQMEQNRLNTIFAVKRLIGLKFDSEEVGTARKKLPYSIIPARNGDAWVEINGVPTSPEEVSSHVLIKMKEVAEAYLKETVNRAVITVPAHFNDSQRQATKDAARIAGLDVMRVINEPTAAALAYGLASVTGGENKKRTVGKKALVVDKIVSVFDLGGGTFDVSILALRDGVFDVLSTHGDTFLGGEDFDLAIVEYLVEEFRRTTGQRFNPDKGVLQKLKLAAVEAKHKLSNEAKVQVFLPYLTADANLDVILDRKTMEKVVQPIITRLEVPCMAALEDAGLAPSDVDETILVGGMTRMPAVKKLCRQVFGKEPIDTVDPDEAVALGAAIQAGLLQGMLKGVSLLDVTSLTLGIEVQGGMVHPLIPRNTKIPVRVVEEFTTSAPNQPQVSIHVVQGESSFAPDNKSLGRFELMGVKPAPRGLPRIAVTLDVDSDGIVHLSAKDVDTGEEKSIEIVANSGLSEKEIDELLRENFVAQQQQQRISRNERIGDATKGDDLLSKARDDLKAVIYMTQFKLDTEGKNFKGTARTTLENCLASSRNVMENGRTVEEVENSLAALTTIAAVFERYLDA